MRILLASSELSPLVRTGGLGDSVAGLARALAKRGLEISVALPRYRHLAGLGEPEEAPAPGEGLRRLERDGVDVLLVEDPAAFDRPGIYGRKPGEAFEDEWWRWGRFALVVRRLAEKFDVLHLQDGHAGGAALAGSTPVILTVHNPVFHVLGPLGEAAWLLELGPEFTRPEGALEWYGRANYLKAGMVGARQVTTISPEFARQLTEEQGLSAGLMGVVASLARPLEGILNGIDTDSWDPGTDPNLRAPFSADDLSGRAASREELMDRTGVDEGMIFGMVGRMADQKGLPLLGAALAGMVEEGFRFVAVGGGELEGMVDEWATARRPPVVFRAPYEERLARLVFAGSDAYLMPSRFEPCGLGQMYAMRYGCPPVVRLTGGLADTVVDLDESPERGNGFGFRPYDPTRLARAVRRAMETLRDSPDVWREVQLRGMKADWSWDRAAARYEEMYQEVA